MFEQFMMPIGHQFDDGFAVVAEAFKDAAEKLASEIEGTLTYPNGHLPINFLYRHAIELYLKSAIVTVHRTLLLPTGDGPHEPDPLIKFSGKWRRIDRTHSVQILLTELTRILTEYKGRLARHTPHNWETPQELIEWIDAIEAADSSSTYFRYPKSGSMAEPEKSGFLPVASEDFVIPNEEGNHGKALFAIVDDDRNIIEAFGLQDSPLTDLRTALVNAAKMMGGYAFGLHAELVDGYERKGFEEMRSKEETIDVVDQD